MYFISVIAKLNFQHHYSSLQCHMTHRWPVVLLSYLCHVHRDSEVVSSGHT